MLWRAGALTSGYQTSGRNLSTLEFDGMTGYNNAILSICTAYFALLTNGYGRETANPPADKHQCYTPTWLDNANNAR
jgi:hypothetical protein